MASNGWAALGEAFAGRGAREDDAYMRGQGKGAQLTSLLAKAERDTAERVAAEQRRDALAKAGYTQEEAGLLSNLFEGGIDPRTLSGYRGDTQAQGFRDKIVESGLAGNMADAGAYSMGLAKGPLELTKILDGTAFNPYAESSQQVYTTPVGQSTIGQRNASAASSYASADNSRASAAKTRQDMRQGAEQFGLQRSGQWNPAGKQSGGGGGSGPLPVGALKELLSVEEALGGTEVLGDIIGKNRSRLQSGGLRVGPGQSLIGRIRTGLGVAGANDVALNEWQADKTKIVNESLRLNKGVQTEGDAIRAGEELMAANDQATLNRALDRLESINNRAIELQSRKQSLINGNYGRISSPGLPPSAAEAFSGVPAAATGGRTPVRAGMSNGRRVIQYSDGSVEYGD